MIRQGDIFTYEPKHVKSSIKCEFDFAVMGLAHVHIYEMCRGLIKAGATLKYVYDLDETLIMQFLNIFPEVIVCRNKEKILSDSSIKLVASAAIPSQRADIAIECMKADKDFFVDKAPFINLNQLEIVRKTIDKTERKYFVFYSESIANEATIFARALIKRGVIGDVFNIEGMAPHLLKAIERPEWFFNKKYTGGIIIDLGSHQIHQFLLLCSASGATVNYAGVSNRNNRNRISFEDFGNFNLTADNGITGYFRLDWCLPNGLSTWGDLRIIIEGSKGYIELRKNCNIGCDNNPNHIFVVTDDGQFHDNVSGKVAITFFDDLIYDCIFRTETVMGYSNQLKTMELAIKAQNIADNARCI